ncbi:uncharacterized protein LOC120314480 [Crotalus tigris]|uniref:uncharacterized protein LOC120314480 n=1 Tax=Crotalus tigris TaxID=88082 RepID=UPI00192F9039|nr:uncharacterized protein LOC120314480 [Crotalus tigris]
MAWILFIFIGLSFFRSSIQQLQSLKDSDFVAPGGTITTSCRYDSGTITDSNYPVWVQQKSEQVPRLLIHSTSTRHTGVPARFSGSRSGNTMSLTITGALVEDEAMYYCVVWTGSGRTVSDSDREPETEVKGASGLHEGTDALGLWGFKSNGVDPKRRSFSFKKMNVSNLPRISIMFFLSIFLATIDLSLQQLQSLKDAESVPLGGTVTLSCRYSTEIINDNNYPCVKPSDVPARFSGSKSGNVMSLTITEALAEDEAIYYCCVHTGSA